MFYDQVIATGIKYRYFISLLSLCFVIYVVYFVTNGPIGLVSTMHFQLLTIFRQLVQHSVRRKKL